MGAVRTAGSGSEVEASANDITLHPITLIPFTQHIPPTAERTLTVGREAIVECGQTRSNARLRR